MKFAKNKGQNASFQKCVTIVIYNDNDQSFIKQCKLENKPSNNDKIISNPVIF